MDTTLPEVCAICGSATDDTALVVNQHLTCPICAATIQDDLAKLNATDSDIFRAAILGGIGAVGLGWARYQFFLSSGTDLPLLSMLSAIPIIWGIRAGIGKKKDRRLQYVALFSTLLAAITAFALMGRFEGPQIFFLVVGLFLSYAAFKPMPIKIEQTKPKAGLTKGAVGAAAVLAAKAKGSLALLQFAKFGKILATFASMLAMVLAYSGRFGIKFAFGFVMGIFIHEMGHVFAARRVGLKTGLPIFIPFVGAFIALKEQPRSRFHDFIIGAGGPIAGGITGLICLDIGLMMAEPWNGFFIALGYLTITINLFNLMPIAFLDGARMTSPIDRFHWLGGLPLVFAAASFGAQESGHINPFIYLILLFGLIAAIRTGAKPASGKMNTGTALEKLQKLTLQKALAERDSIGTTVAQKNIAAVTYFGLASALAFSVDYFWNYIPKY